MRKFTKEFTGRFLNRGASPSNFNLLGSGSKSSSDNMNGDEGNTLLEHFERTERMNLL